MRQSALEVRPTDFNYLRDNLVTKERMIYCNMTFELFQRDKADKTSQG